MELSNVRSSTLRQGRAVKVSYWLSTGLIALTMGMSALTQDLPQSAQTLAALKHLGYPPYLSLLIGTAKLAGIVALLAPKKPILKEWAYTGFAILFVSAVASHLYSGDGPMAAIPVVFLAILGLSYASRPVDRRAYLGR